MSAYRDRMSNVPLPSITPSARQAGVRQDVLSHIELDRLLPSEENPRSSYPEEDIRALADSLLELGQQQPVSCYWSPQVQKYVLLAGHRRYFAAKLAGLPTLAAVVVDEDVDAIRQLARRMAENTARSDMAPLDMANGIKRMIHAGHLTQAQVGRMLGRSQAWVSSQLALLSLPEQQQAELAAGTMPVVQARASAVRKPRKGGRRKPKMLRITQGGISALVKFRRVQDECSLVQALEQLLEAARQIDTQHRQDAA